MRFTSSLLIAATFLAGSLALPQEPSFGSSSATISFPGLTLSPQDQTRCISSCSVQVANANVARTRACSSATGKSPAECLCTDSTLLAGMEACFGQRCAEVKGRCAAIILDHGASSSFTSGATNIGGSGSQGSSSSGTTLLPDLSFPDVKLPAADQSACIKSCSTTVANANLARTHACANTGKGAAQCLCTDTALLAGMQTCYAQKCKELQGRCAAAISEDGSASSFVVGSTSSSSNGGSGTNGGSSSGQGSGNSPAGANNANKNGGGGGSDNGVASTRPVAGSLMIASGAVLASALLF